MRPRAIACHALWTALLGWPAHACLDLVGVVSGGGDGLLDLDLVRVSVNISNPKSFVAGEAAATVFECGGRGVLETPIFMRDTLGIDNALFSVSQMFHPSPYALDVFGDKDKSDSRRRCQPSDEATIEELELFDVHLRVAASYVLTYGSVVSMPFCEDDIDSTMADINLPMSLVYEAEGIETPWGLAKTYVDEVFSYLLEYDGWNADGSMSKGYNRVPYSDYAYTDSDGNSWEPYEPVNSPWKFKHKKRWQPLCEHDDLGFIYSQMHVVPHIGALGRFYGFSSAEDEAEFASRELADPKYDYGSSSLQVLEETRLMATDDFKQAAIRFFDNKFTSLALLKIIYFRNLGDHELIDAFKMIVGAQTAIYNAVVISWKEKMRHDLPRPTSVIHDLFGDAEVVTYAGPGQGVQTIEASEWEPFIRTMPHSEFPSGSACMCKLFAEQMILFTGSDVMDPPLVYPIGTNVTAEFNSWSEVSDICGESRLWGGMHFYDSVPAGADLCGGGLVASSITDTLDRLIAGDETAAIFKYNPGELKVRPV